MKDVLVTGSLAFDYIMRVGGRFGSRLEPTMSAGFSAAFVAPSLQRRFGGCAGNIAYGLRQLGESPVLMATAGEDFPPYREHLRLSDIDDSQVKIIEGAFTAQAFIAADDDESQIIIFHPGATSHAHEQGVGDLSSPPAFAIVSPNGKDGMLRFGRELAETKTPFIFDPGQAIGLFSAAELNEMLSICDIAIFNHDEHVAAEKITGTVFVPGEKQAMVITRGVDGSQVSGGGKTHQTSAAVFGETVDTTGCGDAYRAGMLYGLTREWKWPQIISYASVVAGIKATRPGGQDYTMNAEDVSQKCKQVFG